MAIIERDDFQIGRDDAPDWHRRLRAGFRDWPGPVSFGKKEIRQRSELLSMPRLAPAGQAVQERVQDAFDAADRCWHGRGK